MTWDLGGQKETWKRGIKDALAAEGSKQTVVAARIGELVGAEKPRTTATNNFIGGDPDTVQSWFEDHAEWVAILAEEMGQEPSALRARFDALLGGHRVFGTWHESFPDLTLADVEIPAPFRGSLGTQPDLVAAEWVAEVKRAGSKPGRLVVLGPNNSSRAIATEQLRRAVAALVEGQLVLAAVAEQAEGVWHVLPCEQPPANSTRIVRLVGWGPSAIAAIALRVAAAERTPPAHRAPLQAFAELLGQTGSQSALDLSPDLAIRLVAQIARLGCPVDLPGVRRLLTAGAWQRALNVDDRLSAFDERLLERYFSALAKRASNGDGVDPWHTMPLEAARELLRVVAREEQGELAGVAVSGLVQALLDARREKDRQSAAEALRTACAADPADLLVGALINGRILTVSRRTGREFVHPSAPRLAAIWGARGLRNEVALAAPFHSLCDSAWGELVEEQARLGMAWRTFGSALEQGPEALAVDAAAMSLRFALASPGASMTPALLTHWATLLWATAHGFLDLWAWGEPWGWTASAKPLVTAFTRRFRHDLPRMGDDPLRQVSALVPASALRLVAAWRPTTDRTNHPSMVHGEEFGFLQFSDHSDRTSIIRALQSAAPAVFVYDSPNRVRGWGHPPKDAAERVVEEAGRGDAGCAAMLSGAAFVDLERGDEQNTAWHFWRQLPWDTRVTWAARAGAAGAGGVLLLHELLRTGPPEDRRLIDIAERVGADEMAGECGFALGTMGGDRSLPRQFAFAVAERLHLTDLLERVAAEPFELAPTLIPKLDGGFLRFGPFGGRLDEVDSFRPRLRLRERLDEADARAGQAAVILHRLGDPEALRRRWLNPAPTLPIEAVRAQRRIEWLAALAKSSLGMWRQMEVPLGPLGRFADEPLTAHADMALNQLLGVTRAWSVEAELGRENLPPDVRRALDGLRRLLAGLPEAFPEDLDQAIEGAHPMIRFPYIEAENVHRDAARRAGAARALVLAGDDEPVWIWARRVVDRAARDEDLAHRETGPEHELAAEHAVSELLESDLDTLVRCWQVLRELGGGRVPASRRWGFLSRGSRAHREPSDPRLPLPFVIEEALGGAAPDEVEDLTARNGAHPSWEPVVRHELQRASAPRSRARWAVALAALAPNDPSLAETLQHWLHEDLDPWSGGGRWHRGGNGYVGGARDLLDRALAAPDSWVTTGLVRLFRLALSLPEGGWEDYDKAPPLLALSVLDDPAPWPIRELAQALVARGRGDVVLESWRCPPDAPGDRAEHVRRWLAPLWLRLADDEEIKCRLWTDGRFNLSGAYALLERGRVDLVDDAFRAALELAHPHWHLLGQVAPDRLAEALRARLEGPIPWRLLVGSFAQGAHEIASPAACVAARLRVAGEGTGGDAPGRAESDRGTGT